MALAVKFHVGLIRFLLLKQRSCEIRYGILICTCTCLAGVFYVLWCSTSYGIVPVMALMLKMLNVMSHADPYLHVPHPRCLLCMSADAGRRHFLKIMLGDYFLNEAVHICQEETFRSTASRLAGDF